MNYKNLCFTIVLFLTGFYLYLKDFLVPFVFSDASFISLAILVTFSVVAIRYIIEPIDKKSFVYQFTEYYERIISHMGLLGTMIGFYVAIRSIDGMEIKPENVQQIIEGMMSGFYIALVSTIVSTTIVVIISTMKAMRDNE